MNGWVAASEILRNLALAVAAGVGVYLAWRQLSPASSQAKSASTQADLARRTHVIQLFKDSVGKLRAANLEERLAAIYVLRETAKAFPDLSDPVFELLQTYLRENKTDYGDDLPLQ